MYGALLVRHTACSSVFTNPFLLLGHLRLLLLLQVYRVSEAAVLKQLAYMLFYVRTSMKRQAQLPQHTESDAAASPAAAGGQKRSASTAAAVIGPQLPPHLAAKRQRMLQEEEQQQPGTPASQQQQGVLPAAAGNAAAPDADMFAEEEGDAGAAPSFGPQLPPGWQSRSQAAADAEQQAAKAAGSGSGSEPGSSSSGVEGRQPAAAGNAAIGGNGGAYFAWARPSEQQPQHQHKGQHSEQQQQPRQQQQPALEVAPAGADVVTEQQQQQQQPDATIRGQVEAAVAAAQQHWRPWLFKELTAARSSGLSCEQCSGDIKRRFRSHPVLHCLARQLFQQLLGSSSSGGDEAAQQ
jgi:hypothetical protein